jgi:DNA topoisomerase-1
MIRLSASSEADALSLAQTYAGDWRIVERVEQIEEELAPPPYTTAALLEDAALRLGWNAERTMAVAQRLFEDGHITYPRTDSVYIAPEAAHEIRRIIEREYGAVLGKIFPQSENAGAHEAIRPSEIGRTPEEVADPEGQLLYRLIRQRTLAAYMRPARLRVVTVTLEKE